jgi:hypothetical protein
MNEMWVDYSIQVLNINTKPYQQLIEKDSIDKFLNR